LNRKAHFLRDGKMKLTPFGKIRRRGSLHRESGAVTVEFSLVIPVLLLMLFGIAGFGMFFNNYILLTNAASVGARILASERGYSTPYSDTQAAIQQATTTMHSAPTITMTVGGTACTSDTSCATALGTATQPPPSGTQATVSLTYALPVLAPGSLPRSIASMLPSNVVATMSNYVQ
jgi:Flp pilus assembly protein TadG